MIYSQLQEWPYTIPIKRVFQPIGLKSQAAILMKIKPLKDFPTVDY